MYSSIVPAPKEFKPFMNLHAHYFASGLQLTCSKNTKFAKVSKLGDAQTTFKKIQSIVNVSYEKMEQMAIKEKNRNFFLNDLLMNFEKYYFPKGVSVEVISASNSSSKQK